MVDLFEKFSKFSNKIAIYENDVSYTYEDLINKINIYYDKFANLSNEVVAINLAPSSDFIAIIFALSLRKSIILPMVEYDENKLEFAKFIITKNNIKVLNNKNTHSLIQNLQSKKRSGLILYSSATTGKAKSMLHDFDNMIENFHNKNEKSYNLLLLLFIDHIGGIDCILRTLFEGASISIPKNLTPKEILKCIEKYKVDILPTTPTMLNLLILSGEIPKHDISSLKIITYGAETMSEELLKRVNLTFKNIKIFQKFGTSETGSFSTKNLSNDTLFIKIDDNNVSYKIVDNELYLKTNTQILGYLNTDKSLENGWFKTGDIVVKKGEYLQIVGRKKEIINIGGNKVLPFEVENAIMKLSGIKDVVAYAKDSLITGQMLCVDVVADENITKKDIINICKNNLQKHKIPTQINLKKEINISQRYKKQRL